jgi:hypothetical protein
VRSLTGEYLQELDNFVGSERQKQEEAIIVSMGSMYMGKLLYSRIKFMGLTRPLSAGLDTVRISRYFRGFLTDSYNEDCVLNELPLPGPGPLPTCAKTGASRARYCSRKRPVTHLRRQAASSVHRSSM